jgi:hypothetical protein
VGPHRSFNHVRIVERLFVVISLHSSAGSFNIFAIVHQDFIQLLILIGNLFPIVDDSSPVDNGTVSEQFWHWEYPSVSLPSNICNGVLDESEEVLKTSLLVSLIDALFSKSELLELPIVLLSHRSISMVKIPVSHFQSLETIRSAIIHIVISMISIYCIAYLTFTPSSTGA